MAVAGGLDLHRGQLTFDYVDTGTGESWRGPISPADRESLRGWLRRFHGVPDVEFAVEGCTGWRDSAFIKEGETGFVVALESPAPGHACASPDPPEKVTIGRQARARPMR